MTSVVSVFCGCGGLDHGFKQAGFELTYACDHDAAAVDCYARNVDTAVFQRDVESEEFDRDVKNIENCDVVLGGFPCQGFSKAGPKRSGDNRNTLYLSMQRCVDKLRPSLFLAENVDGLSQNFNGEFVKRIIADFASTGYDVEYQVLDAVSFGVPQHRRRIIFAGVPAGAPAFSFPTPLHNYVKRNGEFVIDKAMPLFDFVSDTEANALQPALTIEDAIGDLLELDGAVNDHVITEAWPTKYRSIIEKIGEGQKLCNVRHASSSVYTWQIPEVFGDVTQREVKILETISRNRRHKQYGDIPNGNPLAIETIVSLSGVDMIEPEIRSLMSKGYLKEIDGKFDLKGAMFCSGLFKRPSWSHPAPTVLTNFHNPRYFLHPKRDRPFSLRECARLQTFPDDFVFVSENVSLVDGYRLVGNAVPPKLSQSLAESALRYIESNRNSMVSN